MSRAMLGPDTTRRVGRVLAARAPGLLLAAALALAACGEGETDTPRPTSIAPASGSQVVPVAVRIRGEGFGAHVTSDFSGAGSAVDARFQALLDDTPLDDVALQQDGTIAATVPAGLAPGAHDLTVIGPDGRAGRLGQAYRVVAPGGAAAVVAGYRVEVAAGQVARQPFTVVITAVDAEGAVVPEYAGTVALSDLTGTAVPRQVGLFAGGRWTGTVELRASSPDDVLTVTDASGATGRSARFPVAPAPAAAVRFATAAARAGAGECAGPVTLSLADAFGRPTAAAATLSLTGAPDAGFALFADAACTAPLAAPDVRGDPGSASVWFHATSAGTLLLEARGGTLAGAAQSWSIAAGPPAAIAFRSSPRAVTAGRCSGPVTVEVRDVFGNASPGGVAAVGLSATSPALELFSDACMTPAASLAVPAGAATADFHLRGTRAERVSVGVSAPGVAGATEAVEVAPDAATALAFVSAPRTAEAGRCSAALTVEARDRFGNAVAGASAIPVTLGATPGASFGFHADPACGGAAGSSVAIAAGESAVTFHFRGSAAREVSITAASPGLSTAAQAARVEPGRPAALVFASPPRAIPVNGCSAPVELGIVDAFANRTPVASPLAVAIDAAPGTEVRLFADPACAVPATAVTVSAGSDAGTVHFSAAAPGSLVLTASAGDLAGAVQAQTVTAAPAKRLAFVTSPRTVAAGECSGPVTIEAEDDWGNPVVISTTAATTVHLTGADLAFSAGSGCAGGTPSFAAGASAATFSFRRTVAGTGPVTVEASAGALGASQGETIVAGPADHLAWGAIPSPQEAGVPFAVSLSARDACENRASYDGTATLSASTGSVSCATSCSTASATAAFASGAWSGTVSVPSAAAGLRLTASTPALKGVSSAFDVEELGPAARSPPLASFTVSPGVVVSGNSVSFDASASSDRQTAAAALSVSWDFEAAASADYASAALPAAAPWTAWTTTRTVSHAYLNHGSEPVVYRPRLAVRDTEAGQGGPDVGYAAGVVVVLPSGEDLCTVDTASLADDGANGCFGPGPDGRLSLTEAVRLANAPGRNRPLNITFSGPFVVTGTAATLTLTRRARILGVPGVILDGVRLDVAAEGVLVVGLEFRHLAAPITVRDQRSRDVRLEQLVVRDGAGILVSDGIALLRDVTMSGCAGTCVRQTGALSYLALFGCDLEGAGDDVGVAVEQCDPAGAGAGSSPYDAWTVSGWGSTGAAFIAATVLTGFDTAVSLPASASCSGPDIRNVTFDRNRIALHAGGSGGLGRLSDSVFTRQTVSAADACGFAAMDRIAAWGNASLGCLSPDVTADPLYVWPAGRDLRLQRGSPLRDAGSAARGVELDDAGPGRYLGAGPDRGGRETY